MFLHMVKPLYVGGDRDAMAGKFSKPQISVIPVGRGNDGVDTLDLHLLLADPWLLPVHPELRILGFEFRMPGQNVL